MALAARRISNSSRYYNYVNRIKSKKLFSSEVKLRDQNESAAEIIIPYRVHRGPTDILKALASTIHKDYTAPKYKYEDDPYFIPVSNVSKRSFALSKESGKKAARYFLDNYPKYFQVHESDPVIKAFDPPKVYTEEDAVTEDTLKSCIESHEVTNSLKIYELLKGKGTSLTQEVKQNLLELLCFYNCTQPPPDDYYEEKWFMFKNGRRQQSWKVNNEAEKLFEEMEPKTEAAYLAMIKGCAKHFHIERTVFYYDELCNKDFKGTTEMYNNLLDLVPYIKSDGESRWELAMHYVQKMNADCKRPNLATMNALLNILSMCRRWHKARSLSTKVLAEMAKFNIEPSLGTYYYILKVFCINSHGYRGVLPQILDRLGTQEFIIRHPEDVSFFTLAMEVCNMCCQNKDLAYRLNNLLEYQNNCIFLGCALLESLYFKHFLRLLCETEEFDKFMEVYDRYVPHTYTPEASVMGKILTALEFAMAYHHLPKICSDVLLFEHTEKENLLREILSISSNAKLENAELQQQLVTIIWNILEKIFQRSENIYKMPFQWSSTMLGDAMKIFLSGKNLEKAWFVLQKMKLLDDTFVDHPDKSIFVQFGQTALAAQDFEKLTFFAKYLNEKEILGVKEEVLKSANTMFDQNQLSRKEKNQIDSMFEPIQCETKTDEKDATEKGNAEEESNSSSV